MSSSSTRELNATGQVFMAYFNDAWKNFENAKYDEANEMALWLLRQPELGLYHRAGSHFILAHSPDCYVHHGREAVRLYKQLSEKTPEQAENKAGLVAWAERVLAKAERDAAELAANPLTEEEYQKHMVEYYRRMEEQEENWKKFELEDYAEEGAEDGGMHGASPGDTTEADTQGTMAQSSQTLSGEGSHTPKLSQSTTTTS